MVELYINCSQNTVVQYILTPPSLEIFTEAEQRRGCGYQTVVGIGRDKLHGRARLTTKTGWDISRN